MQTHVEIQKFESVSMARELKLKCFSVNIKPFDTFKWLFYISNEIIKNKFRRREL